MLLKLFGRTSRFLSNRTMKVVPIPANADNYMYLIIDEATNKAAIVDPVDLTAIKDAVNALKVDLKAAFVTHHHWDHAGGTEDLHNAYAQSNQLQIYGGDSERIKSVDVHLTQDGTEFNLGNLNVKSLFTPCHTTTHVCYYVTDSSKDERAVFTGDTLFIGGCGRFFEGTPEQMNHALNEKLGSLPGDTKVYCGHEYTVANLKFAKHVDPNNTAIDKKLAWAEKERQAGRYTVPSTIAEEKTFNPFMRVMEPALQQSTKAQDFIQVMKKLREMKNNFK